MALLPASESVRDLFRSLGEPGSYGSGTAGPAVHVNIHPFRRSALQGQSHKLAVSVAAR